MNLQSHIKPELWDAISSTYQAENYSHAIVDAMHYLSDFLRERTGVDGDGASLVGQALGGDSPRLRTNKLQTETERNEQRGIEHILRGLYSAVRNPRSHEQAKDSKDTADSIIYFINYILGILAKSEEPFTLDKFMARVFDPAFVESSRYAELLVEEVPLNKLPDTLIQLYREKNRGEGKKLRYVFNAIFDRLSEEQIEQFLSVVSDELKVTQHDIEIIITLTVIRPEFWPKIHEMARMRIENKLIQSIHQGRCWSTGKTDRGLGTWARRFLQHFTMRREVGNALLQKLQNADISHRRYVEKFFLPQLPVVLMSRYQMDICVEEISKAIRNGESNFAERLVDCINGYPEDWQKAFMENLKDLTDLEDPLMYLADGTPFLTRNLPSPQPSEEDIPF